MIEHKTHIFSCRRVYLIDINISEDFTLISWFWSQKPITKAGKEYLLLSGHFLLKTFCLGITVWVKLAGSTDLLVDRRLHKDITLMMNIIFKLIWFFPFSTTHGVRALPPVIMVSQAVRGNCLPLDNGALGTPGAALWSIQEPHVWRPISTRFLTATYFIFGTLRD